MKKILSLFALSIFLLPSLTFAETVTADSLRAEIARLSAMLDGQSQTPVTIVYSCLDLPLLTRGMKNENVTKLQNFLKSQVSSKWDANVSVTGYFGLATQNALANFQVANSIVLTKSSLGAGKFGPKTRAFVKGITCSPPVITINSDANSQINVEAQNSAPVVVDTPTRAPGLYVSVLPQETTPVFEAGELGSIATLRFEAVGMDLNLRRIGLDFTKGDVTGVTMLNVQSINTPNDQTIVGSVNLNSKEFTVDLEREFIIAKGEHKDLNLVVKVGNAISLTNDFYQLNIDTANPNNTFALNAVGEKVYVSNPQKFENQGAWLLDDKQEASLTITSPVIPANYGAGETVKLNWYASALLSDEKVKIDVLNQNGVLGTSVLPSVTVANTGTYDFVVPNGFTTNTGNFALKVSCTIHDCESTSINFGIKTSSTY